MNCPFLEQQQQRCDVYLNVSHLDHVLCMCADHYRQCALYRKLRQEIALVKEPEHHQVRVA